MGNAVHQDPDHDEFSPRYLTSIAKTIYAAGHRLSLQQAVTTVYRPLYGCLESILPWIPRGARLLDVGCGSGTLLLLAARLRALEAGWGFDTQAASIRIAEAANRSPRVSFVCGNAVPVELIEHCDTITVIDVLHHLPRSAKRAMLQRLVQHAPAGTRLIVRDLDPRPRWRAFANRVSDYLSTRSRVDYVALTEVQEWLGHDGIDVIHAVRFNHYAWSLYVLVGHKRSPGGGGAAAEITRRASATDG